MIDDDADEHLERRGDVLHDAEGGEADVSCAVGKQEEREGGDEAAAEQQEVSGGIELAHGTESVVVAPCKEGDGGGGQDERLDGEAGDRADGCGLAMEAVGAPAAGKDEGDPWEAAGHDDHAAHARRRDEHGGDLGPAEVFMEDGAAGDHAEEGNEEVAEARLDDVAGVDAPDIDEPVGGEECGSEDDASDGAGRSERCEGFHAGLPGREEQEPEEDHGPEVPVRDQLDGVHRGESFPIEGNEAPEKVATGGSQRPGSRAPGVIDMGLVSGGGLHRAAARGRYESGAVTPSLGRCRRGMGLGDGIVRRRGPASRCAM